MIFAQLHDLIANIRYLHRLVRIGHCKLQRVNTEFGELWCTKIKKARQEF